MMGPGSRLRRLAVVLGVAAVAALLTLVVLELGLRALGDQLHALGPPGGKYTFNPDPAVMPGVEGPSRVSFNSHGMRADELEDRHRPRVLVFGGSTTACNYVDQDKTWTALLQKHLGDDAWVGNAGKEGLSSRDHVLQMHYLLPEVPGVDVVLCMLGMNDLTLRLQEDEAYDPRFFSRPKLVEKRLDRIFFFRPRGYSFKPWRRTAIYERWARSRIKRTVASHASREDPVGNTYVERRQVRRDAKQIRTELPDLGPALAEFARNVRSMIRIARERDVRIVFATQPAMWDEGLSDDLAALLWFGWIDHKPWGGATEYYSVAALRSTIDRYNATLRETCLAESVECVDLAARLPRDTTVFFDDCHFNDSGSRLVAEVLAEHFAKAPIEPR